MRPPSPSVKPKADTRSNIEKIGNTVGGAIKGIGAEVHGKTPSGANYINVNPFAPIVGAIRGGMLGYQGKSNLIDPPMQSVPAPRPIPKAAPDRANDPRRMTGSGSSMVK